MNFKFKYINFSLLALIFFSGCGTTEIMKNIDNTYTVAAQYGSANGSWDRASKDANEKALVFCEGKGQSISLINERRDGIWGVSPQRAEVKFSCVSIGKSSDYKSQQNTLESRLSELKVLHQKGLLTKEQFDAQVEKTMSMGR